MTYYPMIGIVTAAKAETASQVFAALGWGPGTFGIQLAPTALGPATHYAFGNGSATEADGVAVMAMLDGILPGEDIPWGEEGWPTEIDAIEAVSSPDFDFRIYGGGDGLTPQQRFNNWMGELSLVRVEEP
jgi:hypothetical protein